jgi:cysteine synthase A
MTYDGVVTTLVDRAVRDRAARWLGRAGVRLPNFAELADPALIPEARRTALRSVDPNGLVAANLFRMHWYNDRSRARVAAVPCHLVFPSALTGVRTPIVMTLGCFFPMIGAHKVLAAYGCLIPYLVTGRFDPAHHRAVWPSTGNYCRGGIALSRNSSTAAGLPCCPRG